MEIYKQTFLCNFYNSVEITDNNEIGLKLQYRYSSNFTWFKNRDNR